jgi:hypothetical protein
MSLSTPTNEVGNSFALATFSTPPDNVEEATPRHKVDCRYWAEEKCSKGKGCTFAHDGAGGLLERPICIYWKRGACFNGDACRFRHEEAMTEGGSESSVEEELRARLGDVGTGWEEGEHGTPSES